MLGETGYKLHIVYNALASNSKRSHNSLSNSPSAESFSWDVDATPPKSTTYRPSAHFVLDSTKVDSETLQSVEDILYGTASQEARLPVADELIDIVSLWSPQFITPDTVGGLATLSPGVGDLTPSRTRWHLLAFRVPAWPKMLSADFTDWGKHGLRSLSCCR